MIKELKMGYIPITRYPINHTLHYLSLLYLFIELFRFYALLLHKYYIILELFYL